MSRLTDDGSSLARLYSDRFPGVDELAAKRRVWRVLCRHFFQAYVERTDVVLDLAAGYCEFINEIEARRRIAVDLNPDVAEYADAGVVVLNQPASKIAAIEGGSVDVVFASNFFEHLHSPEDLLSTLDEVHRLLNPDGRLLILQPNIRLIGGGYWDFLDHRLALTERSLEEACKLAGFRVIQCRTRFLPYTTKSRMPQHPLLVRSYLAARPLQLIFGKQTFMVCAPDSRHTESSS